MKVNKNNSCIFFFTETISECNAFSAITRQNNLNFKIKKIVLIPHQKPHCTDLSLFYAYFYLLFS